MFREVLLHSIRFVAVHNPTTGCRADALIEHIADDIIPNVLGFAASKTVVSSALQLVLLEAGSGEPSSVQVRCTDKGVVDSSEPCLVDWLLEDLGGAFTLHPSATLHERTLGITIRPGLAHSVAISCDSMVEGIPRFNLPPQTELRNRSSRSPWNAVRVLRREGWLSTVFVVNTATGMLEERCFPHFAVPQLTLSPSTSSRRLGTDQDCTMVAPKRGWRANGACGSTLQDSFDTTAHGMPRGSPLDCSLARRRAATSSELVPLDPSVIHRLIASLPPPQQMLMQDFVYAVYSQHGMMMHFRKFMTLPRKPHNVIRRLCQFTGLKISHARTRVRGVEKRFRVVVLAAPEVAHVGPADVCGGGATSERDEQQVAGCSSSCSSSRSSAASCGAREDDCESLEGSDGELKGESAAVTDAFGRHASLLPVDPQMPVPIQVVQAAMRFPVRLDSVIPRVNLFYMRLTHGELRRWVSRGCSLGRIQEAAERSADSKAFTIVVKPVGALVEDRRTALKLEDRGGTAAPDPIDAEDVGGALCSLRPEVLREHHSSAWSVNMVLGALEKAPNHTLTLPQLASVVDRRTLGRLIPLLRENKLIVTTGINLHNTSARIGVVALPSAVFSEETKQDLIEDVISRRVSRQSTQLSSVINMGFADLEALDRASVSAIVEVAPRGPLGLASAVPPETGSEGVAGPNRTPRSSGTRDGAAEASGRLKQAASMRRFRVYRDARVDAVENKIMLLRNGYCRHSQLRASRAHLELWHQWFAKGKPGALSLSSVLEDMSLSTFCVCIGIAAVDVGEYLSGAHTNSGSAEEAVSCRWGWATPMSQLPPSLRALCSRCSSEPFLQCLGFLQREGLLTCSEPLGASCMDALDRVHVVLSSRVPGIPLTDASHGPGGPAEVEFYGEASGVSPGDVCRAILSFWATMWPRYYPGSRRVFRSYQVILEAEPQLNNAQVLAIAKAFRLDVALAAEGLFQRNGLFPFPKPQSLAEAIYWLPDTLKLTELGQLSDGEKRLALRRTQGAVRGISHMLGKLRYSKVYIDLSAVNLAVLQAVTLAPSDATKMLGKLEVLVTRSIRCSRKNPSGKQHSMVGVMRLLDVLHRLITSRSATVKGPEASPKVTRLVARGIANSVLSPDLAVGLPRAAFPTFQGSSELGQPLGPADTAESVTDIVDNAAVTATPTVAAHEQPDEMLQDIIRMVLLSDEAHCNAGTVGLLLAAYTNEEVERCSLWLQQFPAFRHRDFRRLRGISLSSSASLLPKRFGLVHLSQNALAAAAHQMTADLLQRPLGIPCEPHCNGAWTSLVREADCANFDAVNEAHAPCLDGRGRYQLLSQPVMRREDLSACLGEDRGLEILRLPHLLWCEPARRHEPSAGCSGVRAPVSLGARSGEMRSLSSTSEPHLSSTQPVAQLSHAAAAEGIGIQCSITEAGRANPYPARAAKSRLAMRANKALLELPADSHPLMLVDVEHSSLVRATGSCSTGKDSDRRCAAVEGVEQGAYRACHYPSIFFHVDGTFHEFVWRSVLATVHGLVLESSGITHSTLLAQVCSSGLVGSRSCRAAVQFLVESGVLRLRRYTRSVLCPAAEVGHTLCCRKRPRAEDGAAEDLRGSDLDEGAAYFMAFQPLRPINVLSL